MRHLALFPMQWIAVALALLRGLPEFASLQRWRLKAWIAR